MMKCAMHKMLWLMPLKLKATRFNMKQFFYELSVAIAFVAITFSPLWFCIATMKP